MKTPGFGEKGRTLEWNFKNTEILKKHGIFKNTEVLKTRNFEKKHGIFKNLEFFERIFSKWTGFLKPVIFENGWGF